MQHHQRLVQLPDAVGQVGILEVLHEVPADLHPFAAEVHLGAAFAQDPVQGGVEDVGHVLRRERGAHGGDGVELRDLAGRGQDGGTAEGVAHQQGYFPAGGPHELGRRRPCLRPCG